MENPFKNLVHRILHPALHAGTAAPVPAVPQLPAGHERLFTDAIHDRLDQRRPGGTPPAAIRALTRLIESRLRPGRMDRDGNHVTGFTAISRTPAGRYNVTMQNGQCLSRSRSEAELHVLLQSQLWRAGAVASEAGDFVDSDRRSGVSGNRLGCSGATRVGMPAPAVVSNAPSASVVPERAASRVSGSTFAQANAASFEPMIMEDRSGTAMKIFKSDMVDMEALDVSLRYSHRLKDISGANSNCWWRAAIAAAVIRHAMEPDALARALDRLELGADYAQDVRNVTAMARAVGQRGVGMTAIFNGLTHAHKNHDLGLESGLKLPHETQRFDADGNAVESEGEVSCKRLTAAILTKKGYDGGDIRSAVFGSAPAHQELVTGLMRALDADVVIFNTPWLRKSFSSSGILQAPVRSYAESSLSICTQPGSDLDRLVYEPNRKDCTEAIVREIDLHPVLAINTGHYKLYIPSAVIALSEYVA